MIDRYAEEQRRADVRTARICWTIATAMMKKQSGEPFEIEDFLPAVPETEADRITRLEKIMMAMVEGGAS